MFLFKKKTWKTALSLRKASGPIIIACLNPTPFWHLFYYGSLIFFSMVVFCYCSLFQKFPALWIDFYLISDEDIAFGPVLPIPLL